ncbi:MAG: hypothetical protein K8R46_11050, partial [Pirellulales bacterium]|nr:hypothetical protein [Pirellulales bacterium]
MNVLLISIAVATLGVDYGWKRLPDGGSEYIIQLNRQTLDALRDGQPIQSDVMPDAGKVQSFRIVVGDEKLSRDKPLRKPTVQTAVVKPPQLPPNPLLPNAAVKPLAGRQATYTQPEKNTAKDKPKPPSPPKAVAEQPAKPWLPFTLTLFGLFASLGANAYLGWISWGLRRRRRAEI